MTKLKNICVYCGSNNGERPEYEAAAETLGKTIAKAGIRLIYGGGSIGLMGTVARTVLANGGGVTGIIPQFLKDREVMLGEASELIVTDDMHERKRLMFERSDAFITLPGGIGTLEEVVEMMTWAQLDQHTKPILIVNIAGFWDSLIGLFDHMANEGFLRKEFLGNAPVLPVEFCPSVDGVLEQLEAAIERAGQPHHADEAKLM